MKYSTFLIFAVIIFFSCNDESGNDELLDDTVSILIDPTVETEIDTTKLIIEGDDIWVREKPFTGDVVMKLNTGDICKIIEKGEKVQVRDMTDHWYKIEFEGKTGWVFGSQTSRATGEKNDIILFADFLKDYIKEFNKVKVKLKKFSHKEAGYVYMFNPGVYCAGSGDTHDRYISEPIDTKNIFEGFPKGDFCEGYAGIKDGFYYEKIKKAQLPTFLVNWDDDGNEVMGTIEIPDKYSGNTIYKVQVITDEYHNSYHYFLNIGNTWYLICEDHCDCSA